MIEKLVFTDEEGTKSDIDVIVYALSTCGFCRRGLKFLRNNNIKFKFIYLDKIDIKDKKKVKEELKDLFDKRVAFPFAVFDGKNAEVGFTEDKWKKLLSL